MIKVVDNAKKFLVDNGIIEPTTVRADGMYAVVGTVQQMALFMIQFGMDHETIIEELVPYKEDPNVKEYLAVSCYESFCDVFVIRDEKPSLNRHISECVNLNAARDGKNEGDVVVLATELTPTFEKEFRDTIALITQSAEDGLTPVF
jgi:hypothetical protein